MRSTKGPPAMFKLIAGPSPLRGAVWEVAGNRYPVAKMAGEIITLASPLRDGMTTSRVSQFTWPSAPKYVA